MPQSVFPVPPISGLIHAGHVRYEIHQAMTADQAKHEVVATLELFSVSKEHQLHGTGLPAHQVRSQARLKAFNLTERELEGLECALRQFRVSRDLGSGRVEPVTALGPRAGRVVPYEPPKVLDFASGFATLVHLARRWGR